MIRIIKKIFGSDMNEPNIELNYMSHLLEKQIKILEKIERKLKGNSNENEKQPA